MASSRPASTSRRSIARANSINCYSILKPWPATSASVLCGLVQMCSCSSLRAGLTIRSSFAEALSLRMRHADQATSPLPFPRTRSRLGEHDCASVESKLNLKFSGREVVPVCISGIRMPTCLSWPLQASGPIIEPANRISVEVQAVFESSDLDGTARWPYARLSEMPQYSRCLVPTCPRLLQVMPEDVSPRDNRDQDHAQRDRFEILCELRRVHARPPLR